MNNADIKAYVNRNWAVMDDLNRCYWAGEYRRHGASSTIKAAQILWLHMKSIRPDWPSPEERDLDLQHHIALKQLLDKVDNKLHSVK